MNKEKYLPLGTVVLLNNAQKRLMIIGYVVKGSTTGNKIYDYVGCLYPEGLISSDKNLLFNHDQIKEIYYMGYNDDEWKLTHENIKKMASNLEKGNFSMTTPKLEVKSNIQVDSTDLFN